MPDAGRQIWEIRVPKNVELTLLEDKKWARTNQNCWKRNQKKNWLSCHALENSTKSKRESRSKKECWENDEKTA